MRARNQRPWLLHIRHGVLAVLALTTTVLAILVWKWIVATVLLWTVGRHVIHKALGTRPRPRSSWSSLLRSGAIAYAAWNSRWLKPTTPIRARVPEKGQPTAEDLKGRWS